MTIARTIAIALVGLSIGFSTTSSAHAGRFTDAVKGATKQVIIKAAGLESLQASIQAGAIANKQRQAREAAEQDKSQFGWLGNKEYVACLKVDTARNCNLKTFGVEKITRR